jgi:predicted methyltransferase
LKHISFLMVIIFGFVGCSSKSKVETTKASMVAPTTLEEAVASEYRSADFRNRDLFRHPTETLTFFGLEPQMTVLEISPSGGWYTQILAPFLNEKGQYIAVQVPSSASEYMKNNNDQRDLWLKEHASITSNAKVVDFLPADQEIAPENSADMVLTFRNVHNWMGNNGQDAAFKSFFKALKPGGVLGIVEHRAGKKQKGEALKKSGYVRESDVIKMAQKAGFKLVSKSEINANAKDTKNYEQGVWTLPPVLRLKEKDREKYLAIGESDRMTLKFMKPIKK